jgi:hypothetical protein
MGFPEFCGNGRPGVTGEGETPQIGRSKGEKVSAKVDENDGKPVS